MSALLVIISLTILYLSKKYLTTLLSRFIHRLGGGSRAAIIVWSIIFLPGTIIHEVSHFLAAALTGARTGKIEIFPEYLEDEVEEETHRTVALGYVQTQRLNPIQGFLVGIAPFISGLALLVLLASLMQTNLVSKNYTLLAVQGYLFFTIANSFFPSWSDIKQTLTLIILALIVAIVAWFFGFQILIDESSKIWGILDSLWMALSVSIILNLVILFLLFALTRLLKKSNR